MRYQSRVLIHGLSSFAFSLAACRSGNDHVPPAQSAGDRLGSVAVATEAEGAVVLDTATTRRMGIIVAPVRPSALGAPLTVALPGVVVADPQGTAIVRAPVSGKLNAVGQRPWPLFGKMVQAGDQLGQVSDALPIAAPAPGVVTRVMAHPGEAVQAGQELLEITDFSRPLVRIGWRPEVVGGPPARLQIEFTGRSGRVWAAYAGPATEADPLTRLPAYLYRIEGLSFDARPGMALVARVPDPRSARGGMLVLASAVVQWEGLTWVFVQRGTGRYVRTRIPVDRPIREYYLVGSGLGPKDVIVIHGAEQLLSEEFRSKITVGEEVGE
jgi:biotin carboxyl carrier protein